MRYYLFFFGIVAGPALAIDDCLVGTWQADLNDLAATMAAQMNGEASVTNGSVTMVISGDDTLSMVVDDLTYDIQVPDTPAMSVSVTGTNAANIVAEGGNWSLEATSYDLVATANVMGQSMVIPVTSDTGMFGGGTGSYTCSGSSIAFESSDDIVRMPGTWTRVE